MEKDCSIYLVVRWTPTYPYTCEFSPCSNNDEWDGLLDNSCKETKGLVSSPLLGNGIGSWIGIFSIIISFLVIVFLLTPLFFTISHKCGLHCIDLGGLGDDRR